MAYKFQFGAATMSGSLTQENGIVSDTLGASYKMLSFLQVAKNNQQARDPRIELVVEHSKYEVDFLKNKIVRLDEIHFNPEDSPNDQILKATSPDHPID